MAPGALRFRWALADNFRLQKLLKRCYSRGSTRDATQKKLLKRCWTTREMLKCQMPAYFEVVERPHAFRARVWKLEIQTLEFKSVALSMSVGYRGVSWLLLFSFFIFRRGTLTSNDSNFEVDTHWPQRASLSLCQLCLLTPYMLLSHSLDSRVWSSLLLKSPI